MVTPWAIQSMEFSRPEYWSGQPSPSPGIKPRSPAVQAESLPAEPQGKPKNTGVGSLSLLQGIFLNQESSWGLLHCGWILYQLSLRLQCSITSGKQTLTGHATEPLITRSVHMPSPRGPLTLPLSIKLHPLPFCLLFLIPGNCYSVLHFHNFVISSMLHE